MAGNSFECSGVAFVEEIGRNSVLLFVYFACQIGENVVGTELCRAVCEHRTAYQCRIVIGVGCRKRYAYAHSIIHLIGVVGALSATMHIKFAEMVHL